MSEQPTIRFHDHGSTAQEIPGQTDTTNMLRLPRARRKKHEFTYVHYSSGWNFYGAAGWLPALMEQAHYPGVNGVKRDAHGRANPRGALSVHAENGALVLHRSKFRLDGLDYVVRHACIDGGWHYTNRFQSFVTLGGKTRPRYDREGYLSWVLSLLDDGHVDAMPFEVLEDKLAAVDARIRRLNQDPRIGSRYIEEGLRDTRALRDEMVQAWRARFDLDYEAPPEPEAASPEPTPAPAPKRTRKVRSDKGKKRPPEGAPTTFVNPED